MAPHPRFKTNSLTALSGTFSSPHTQRPEIARASGYLDEGEPDSTDRDAINKA